MTAALLALYVVYVLCAVLLLATLFVVSLALSAMRQMVRKRRDQLRVLGSQMSYDEFLRRYPQRNVHLD